MARNTDQVASESDADATWCCHLLETLDMLSYVLDYKEAINQMTQRQEGGMCKYELSDLEWLILDQLQHMLKVDSAHRRITYVSTS